jgi:hypothetical protein
LFGNGQHRPGGERKAVSLFVIICCASPAPCSSENYQDSTGIARRWTRADAKTPLDSGIVPCILRITL